MIDIEAELRADNPTARPMDVHIYANALRCYHEAAENVKVNGAICSHPRTGAPIENPYLKVQVQQGAVLRQFMRMRSDRVLALLTGSAASESVPEDDDQVDAESLFS